MSENSNVSNLKVEEFEPSIHQSHEEFIVAFAKISREDRAKIDALSKELVGQGASAAAKIKGVTHNAPNKEAEQTPRRS